ncbi:hypothetical protein J27TS8_00350 [Robertmurraya siralis]|uniref:DUF2584 domain-containing protein n=1 Tax=Robertmurraya siralis TaxID=77777 RepID=A0A919WDY0_9BACI|nr:DUF2584 domain-containing protein [Robertmurraya siralis]PAE19387.1 hypothetical protein CHH80_16525 [Bacillus sp. 7504-2]GIN60042.1 hypothetical protein J27TS8_00350 [Robertmurraya siralis]
MGMPLELNTMIVTKGNEMRVRENLFTLVKEGFRLYPVEIPIEVRRTMEGDLIGIAKIKKVEWENNETTLHYQLIALNSTN